MDVKGKIVEIFETTQVSDKFKKREFVVEYAENIQYPEYIKFEVIQDKCDLLNGFAPGQEIDVFFNLKGRKWTDPKGETKYFNTLQAWKIQGSSSNSSTPNNFEPQGQAKAGSDFSSDEGSDDLPF